MPEPRSPHGVDIAPKGDYITVSGKLDPHATVYGFDLIKKAIEAKNYEGKDRYGVPILKFDAVVAGKVELGAGPLHTQYDNKGNAYTSLYLESAVAKWTLGPPYHPADQAFKLVDKVSIHYNIGHLVDGAGGHDGSAGQVPHCHEQVVDRPPHECRSAASRRTSS